MDEEAKEVKAAPQPVDYAETLRQFGAVHRVSSQPSTYRMSERNKRKLQLMQQRAQQLKGGI